MGRVLQHYASTEPCGGALDTSSTLECLNSGREARPKPVKRRLSAVQARLSYVLKKIRPENARRRDLARGADEDRKENEKNYE